MLSDHNMSVVRRRCCRNRHCRSRKLSNFLFLFKNHLATFNQTWYKAFMGKGFKSCSDKGLHPFTMGEKNGRAKIYSHIKIFSSTTTRSISTKLGAMYIYTRGTQVFGFFLNNRPFIYQKGDGDFSSHNGIA